MAIINLSQSNNSGLAETNPRSSNHHVSEEHLDRYVDEFAFRYNRRDVSDAERAVMAIKKVGGKRLMYKEPTKK